MLVGDQYGQRGRQQLRTMLAGVLQQLGIVLELPQFRILQGGL